MNSTSAVHTPRLRRRALDAPIDVILLYHRVAEAASDPQLLAVTPRNFAEQLDALGEHFDIVPLSRIGEIAAGAAAQRPRAAITFDDGYVDNLLLAKPILEARDIPATVFVATAYTDEGYEFWWDELERLVLSPEKWPNSFVLCVNGETVTFDAGDVEPKTFAAWQTHRDWNVTRPDDPTARHRVYRELFARLRPMLEDDRRRVLDELAAVANGGIQAAIREPSNRRATSESLVPCAIRAPDLPRRPMTSEELPRLIEGGLIEVGSHTVTHPVLSARSVEEQEIELRESKRRLEELLSRSIERFSYPFGTRKDYTTDTVALVRRAGYALACSNFEPRRAAGKSQQAAEERHRGIDGIADRDERGMEPGNREQVQREALRGDHRVAGNAPPYADRFQLPRVLVRNWDGETLLRRLAEVTARG